MSRIRFTQAHICCTILDGDTLRFMDFWIAFLYCLAPALFIWLAPRLRCLMTTFAVVIPCKFLHRHHRERCLRDDFRPLHLQNPWKKGRLFVRQIRKPSFTKIRLYCCAVSFSIKIAIYLCPSYRRSLQPSNENIQHFKK